MNGQNLLEQGRGLRGGGAAGAEVTDDEQVDFAPPGVVEAGHDEVDHVVLGVGGDVAGGEVFLEGAVGEFEGAVATPLQ